MKNTQMKWLSCCVGTCIVAGTALAQVGTTPPATTTDRNSAYTKSDMAANSHFFRSKDLVGTNVKDSQGEKVGDIKELYLNPQSGIAFAAIDIAGSRHAVVPLQALKVSHTKGVLKDSTEIMINKTKTDMQSGPTITESEWSKLDDANFTQQVFTAYNLQMPAAMGGAESPGGSSSQSTTQPHSTQPLK